MTSPRPRAAAHDRPARATAEVPEQSGRWARIAVALPDRIVMLLFWCALVVAIAVLFSQFRPVVVLPLILVVVVSTWRLMPAALPATRGHVGSSIAALALAVVWLVANVPYASTFITVWRDPGFLTLEGMWLRGHPGPDIPVGAALQVQDAVPGLTAATGAYDLVGGSLQVQGAKLLPGMLGLAGWLGGERALLEANLVIGAVGLLAVFALGRRIVRPAIALVPAVALGCSLPMLVFSRAAYTEPLALALAVGGLTMAWSAAESRTWWRYLVAGGMVGATALVRIDGAASVIGIVAGVGLTAAAAVAPRARRRQLLALSLVAVAAVSMVILGYLDLRLYSEDYLTDHWPQFTSLIAVLVVTVCAVFALSLPRSLGGARRWVLAQRRPLAVGAAGLVGLVAVILASRPLWLVNHRVPGNSGYSYHVGLLQAAAGLPLDPTRSYDEYSLWWHAWYYGWPMVVLAVVGLAVAGYRMVARRDPRLALLLGVLVAPSLLYLWAVSITPDQIWAMRRFLPVTVPGLLLACAVALDALWSRRWRFARPLAVLGGALVLLYPVFTWGSLLGVVEQDGRLPEAHTACAAIGDDPVVYMHVGTVSPPYLATLRTMCDVEVVQAAEQLSTSDLVAIRHAWGDRDVKIVAFLPEALPWPDGDVPDPLRTTTISSWEESLQSIPSDVVETRSTLWVATIEPDGSLSPVFSVGTAAP